MIKELLSPWNVSYTIEDDADVSLVYRLKPIDAKSTVIIPSDDNKFVSWAKKNRLQVNYKNGYPIFRCRNYSNNPFHNPSNTILL